MVLYFGISDIIGYLQIIKLLEFQTQLNINDEVDKNCKHQKLLNKKWTNIISSLDHNS